MSLDNQIYLSAKRNQDQERETRATVSFQASGNTEFPKGDCIAIRSSTVCVRVFSNLGAGTNIGSSRQGPGREGPGRDVSGQG